MTFVPEQIIETSSVMTRAGLVRAVDGLDSRLCVSQDQDLWILDFVGRWQCWNHQRRLRQDFSKSRLNHMARNRRRQAELMLAIVARHKAALSEGKIDEILRHQTHRKRFPYLEKQ
jgi:hypothetical protein